jgi:hypothetical protein
MSGEALATYYFHSCTYVRACVGAYVRHNVHVMACFSEMVEDIQMKLCGWVDGGHSPDCDFNIFCV